MSRGSSQSLAQALSGPQSSTSSLAALAQAAVKEHYGIREEKVAELGLQPFRGRKLKLAAKETASQAPAPEKPETSTLPAPTGSKP